MIYLAPALIAALVILAVVAGWRWIDRVSSEDHVHFDGEERQMSADSAMLKFPKADEWEKQTREDIRRKLAGRAMAAIIVAHSDTDELPDCEAVAEDAVLYADALLAELARPAGKSDAEVLAELLPSAGTIGD